MQLDNRNKKVADDPEVKEVEEAPVIEDSEDMPTEDMVDDVIDEEEEVEEEVEEEEVEEQEAKKPVKPEVPEIEERYKESSREAMVLYAKNKKLNDTIEEASNLPEPTQEEMIAYAKSSGSDYEYLDEFSRAMLKDTLMSKRRFEKIDEARRDAQQVDRWVDKVDQYTNSPDVVNNYPVIADNPEEFKSYCLKNNRRGADLEMLSAAFLYGYNPKTTPKKGSALLSGGNGRVTPEKPKGLNENDLALIRKNNPRKYREIIKSGKANLDI